MSLLSLIGNIFKPATELVDNLHTSDEERLELKNQLESIKNELSGKVLEYETELIKAQTAIITAEAQGRSWLQCNWRPLLMVTIVAIVANNFLIFPYLSLWTDKVVMLELPRELYALMKVGVGGYIASRGAEEVMAREYK